MKKLLLTVAIAVFGIIGTQAQTTSFGVMGGLSMFSPAGDVDGDSETGFHVGAMANLGISESFAVQPELTYAMAGDLSMININAIAKYYVTDGLNLQAGPQIGFIGGDTADALDELFGDDYSSMNIAIGTGLGYDITENFFAQARYAFQLNSHYSGDLDGADFKFNALTVSVGYKF